MHLTATPVKVSVSEPTEDQLAVAEICNARPSALRQYDRWMPGWHPGPSRLICCWFSLLVFTCIEGWLNGSEGFRIEKVIIR